MRHFLHRLLSSSFSAAVASSSSSCNMHTSSSALWKPDPRRLLWSWPLLPITPFHQILDREIKHLAYNGEIKHLAYVVHDVANVHFMVPKADNIQTLNKTMGHQRMYASKLKKYKIKAYSSFKERFKTKANGEVKRWKAGKRHNAHSKTNKQLRQLRQPTVVHSAYATMMKKLNFLG